MEHKKIIEYHFYTNKELINKLVDKGLMISDEYKLLIYLKWFN